MTTNTEVTQHQTESHSPAKQARSIFSDIERHCPRYVCLSTMSTCDAVYVERSFEYKLFREGRRLGGSGVERLLEILTPLGTSSRVLAIKQVVLLKRSDGTFRLKWTKAQEKSATLFLISIAGCMDQVAVLPVQYLRTRFGESRTMVSEFPNNQVPTLFAPFMVDLKQIRSFFDSIYYHASSSGLFTLYNPTYHGQYHRWTPQLRNLDDFLPKETWMLKLVAVQSLYVAARWQNMTFRLSRKGEGGHFRLNDISVEYWRKAWCRFNRADGPAICLTLVHQLSVNASSAFLYLESVDTTEALCIPRELVPQKVIGYTRNGGRINNEGPVVFRILASEWERFTFKTINPTQIVAKIAFITGSYH